MSQPAATQKKFGKSTREVPHPTQQAQKWYPAEDTPEPKTVSVVFCCCRRCCFCGALRLRLEEERTKQRNKKGEVGTMLDHAGNGITE